MILTHDVLTMTCSLGGVFGAFGVAHHTRLRLAKVFFYLLSVVFLGHILALAKGNQLAASTLHEASTCMSALTLLIYAFSVKNYWRHDQKTTRRSFL